MRRRQPIVRKDGRYGAPPQGFSTAIEPLSAKLPTIGSRLRNRHGVEWGVADHTCAKNALTKPDADQEAMCYPVVFPENLSDLFNEFLAEIARCTPKIILPLDTMPKVFTNRSHPGGHSMDAWSHPEAIHIFIDTDDCCEVVLAHELAHAWIDLVKGIEDHRVWRDLQDQGRYMQVQYMQNFVLDFAVDQVLTEKGFDQTRIRADWEAASSQLRIAAQHGYRPQNPREAIYMASHLASVLVEESVSSLPVPLADYLPVVKRNLPEIFSTASGLAQAVSDSFPVDGLSAVKAIDSVLEQSFAFTDPGLDYESQLLYVEPLVDWEMNKTPDWLHDQPVRAKCEIGVAMARLGATSADVPILSANGPLVEICFQRPDGSRTDSVLLEHAVIPARAGDEVRRANRVIEEMRQGKKRMEEMKKRMEPKPMASPNPMANLPGTPKPGNPGVPLPPPMSGPHSRGYSPGMARWLTKVRMEEMLAGEHPYGYANQNPVTMIDPAGLQPIFPFPVPGGPQYPPDPISLLPSPICDIYGPLLPPPKSGIGSCYNGENRNCCTACGICFSYAQECSNGVAALKGSGFECGDILVCCSPNTCVRVIVTDKGKGKEGENRIVDFGCCFAQKTGIMKDRGLVPVTCRKIGNQKIKRVCWDNSFGPRGCPGKKGHLCD